MGQIYEITITNDQGETELIRWHPGEDKTEKELQEKRAELQGDYDSKQYQRDRASVYPSWQTQLDQLFHQGYDGWKAEVQKVKDAHPKPSE